MLIWKDPNMLLAEFRLVLLVMVTMNLIMKIFKIGVEFVSRTIPKKMFILTLL